MSRVERLLELLIRVQTQQRFTVGDMAAEFGVSRRTMLRDLHALSAMGLPLASCPGPHGGYRLITRTRSLPLSLTADEALGMILSYEAFLQYAASPFAAQSLSAITKLRAALPPEVVGALDRLHEHVVVAQATPRYQAPLLGDVLQAALDRVHLDIVYDSPSGVSERRIFVHGLFAEQGFWYCACYDYKRRIDLMLRVDRIHALSRVEGIAPPSSLSLREWLRTRESNPEQLLAFRARATRRGARSADLAALFGDMRVDESGAATIATSIPSTELEWYASRLVSLGTDIVIESPPELIEIMIRRARETLALYR